MPTSNRSKPIEDYAMIGDGGTAALIARDGSVDWLCWPRFDSDACFAALLGDDSHGVWRIAPTSEATITRRYLPDTLILETEFETDTGRLRLTDFMPPRRDGIASLVRRLEVLSGEVGIDCVVSIRFGYGEIPPWLEPLNETPTAFFGEVGPDLVVLRGPGLWLDEEALRAGSVSRRASAPTTSSSTAHLRRRRPHRSMSRMPSSERPGSGATGSRRSTRQPTGRTQSNARS